MQGPISRFAASMADARAERRESSNAPIVELDDLDRRSIPSLVRLRTWRVVRLAVSIVAIPVGWILALHASGLIPVIALALCLAGVLNTLMTVYLLVHVQKTLREARYEASFGLVRTEPPARRRRR